jgi:hypothetical protein
MSATKTRTPVWLTAADVDKVVDQLQRGYNAVDGFNLSLVGLLDEQAPFEPKDGVPGVTVENVAALALICSELQWRMEGLEVWLDEFREARDAAAVLCSVERDAEMFVKEVAQTEEGRQLIEKALGVEPGSLSRDENDDAS